MMANTTFRGHMVTGAPLATLGDHAWASLEDLQEEAPGKRAPQAGGARAVPRPYCLWAWVPGSGLCAERRAEVDGPKKMVPQGHMAALGLLGLCH